VLAIGRVVVHGTAYFKSVPQQHGTEFGHEFFPGIGIRAVIAAEVPVDPGGVTRGMDDFVGLGRVVGATGVEGKMDLIRRGDVTVPITPVLHLHRPGPKKGLSKSRPIV
jgi:hypothetical protein